VLEIGQLLPEDLPDEGGIALLVGVWESPLREGALIPWRWSTWSFIRSQSHTSLETDGVGGIAPRWLNTLNERALSSIPVSRGDPAYHSARNQLENLVKGDIIE
jgi:hypothetical protein